MKKLWILVVIAVAAPAYAATAFWTGRQEQVQTVTYKWMWKCEYNYAGQKFWQIHEGSCPSSVEVE